MTWYTSGHLLFADIARYYCYLDDIARYQADIARYYRYQEDIARYQADIARYSRYQDDIAQYYTDITRYSDDIAIYCMILFDITYISNILYDII